MKPTMFLTIAKAVWIAIALVVFFVTVVYFDGKKYSDIWVFLTWSMLILSFPASVLVSLVHKVLGVGLSMTITTSYTSLVIEWAAYFVLGYLQWFVLFPLLWRKWKRRRSQAT